MGMKVNGSTGLTFPDSTTMSTGSQAVRAWVNFNGTGTVAIRASYNVTSITDNGTGDYTLNFTTAMQDANYSESISFVDTNGYYVCPVGTNYSKSTNSFRLGILAGAPNNPTSFSARDMNNVNVAIFR